MEEMKRRIEDKDPLRKSLVNDKPRPQRPTSAGGKPLPPSDRPVPPPPGKSVGR